MKLTTKHYVIGGVILAVVGVVSYFALKPKSESKPETTPSGGTMNPTQGSGSTGPVTSGGRTGAVSDSGATTNVPGRTGVSTGPGRTGTQSSIVNSNIAPLNTNVQFHL